MAPSLPVEIWMQIIESLCMHCQMPEHSHGMADFRLPEARKGKAAIKALCSVSHDFRSMSQGILFHYFLNFSNGGQPSGSLSMVDLAPRFIRALIANPSMGSRVRMMGLFSHPSDHFQGITRRDLQTWTRVSASYHIQVPAVITEALAAQKQGKAPWRFFKKPGPDSQLRLSKKVTCDIRESVYRWLHVLVMNLVPEITHLQLTWPLAFWGDLQNPSPTFLQLRELTYDKFEGPEDVIESLARFPSLSSFCCRNFSRPEPRTIDDPITATNIRKLSVSCTPRELSLLLKFCPNLEDLEIHTDPHRRTSHPETIFSVKWPAHTKRNVRRLAWSNADAIACAKFRLYGFASIVPLLDFKSLQILEIDYSSLFLYGKSIRAENLGSVLPKTLRILHIAFARDLSSRNEIAHQLDKVVLAKATSVSKLSIVKVDDIPRPLGTKRTLADVLAQTGVVSRMKEAAIDLRVGREDRKSYKSRCILPPPQGAAGHPYHVNFQREVFPLDDLEALLRPPTGGRLSSCLGAPVMTIEQRYNIDMQSRS